MSKETVYDILVLYLYQREKDTLDTPFIERRLKKIGKSGDEIEMILIEFRYEWDQHLAHQNELKKAKMNLIVGSFLAIASGTVCILVALNVISFGNLPIIPYGLTAAGILAALSGWNKLRLGELKEQRLRLKYERW